MNKVHEHRFLESGEDLAEHINEKANLLYKKLKQFDIHETEIDDFGKHYFSSHHGGNRLYFSVQSSAHIIFNSVKKTRKPLDRIAFIDYGAGLGTLFLLAGIVGFKQVYFNDYFPQWSSYAAVICEKIGIKISGFISGGIEEVIEEAREKEIFFDIVASRNVIEHIYDLRTFYTKLYQSGIVSVCYGTTTANYHNIAMRIKHYWHHHKVEKAWYRKQREERIKATLPSVSSDDLKQLIRLTRGKAFEDFTNTITLYFEKRPVPPVEFLHTNTCDCNTGVWAEHLITKKNYLDIIQKAGFSVTYSAGFWDTHYKYAVLNSFARLLNKVIKLAGKKGYCFAPFVNVVAYKDH